MHQFEAKDIPTLTGAELHHNEPLNNQYHASPDLNVNFIHISKSFSLLFPL